MAACPYCASPTPHLASFCPICGRPVRAASPPPAHTPPPTLQELTRDPFETPGEFAERLEALEARAAGTATLVKAAYDIHTGIFPLEISWSGWTAPLTPRSSGFHLVLPRDIARPLFESGPSYPIYVYMTASSDRPVVDWVELKAGPARYLVHPSSAPSISLHASFDVDAPQVTSLAFSTDGRTLAFGVPGGDVVLRSLRSGETIARLPGHGSASCHLAFSPDGKLLASGCLGAPSMLWRLDELRSPLLLGSRPARAVAFRPGAPHLAEGGDDGLVTVWNTQRAAPEATLAVHDLVVSLAYSPDGRLLVAGGESGRLAVFEAESFAELAPLSGPSAGSLRVSFSRDGKLLAAGAADGTVALFALPGPRPAGSLAAAAEGFVSAVAFSPDRQLLAVGGKGPKVSLWDASTRKHLGLVGTTLGRVLSLAFSPDGGLLASGGDGGRVQLHRLLGYQGA